MTPRSPARKILTVLAALTVAGVSLWYLGTRVFVMSGTKSTFSFVGTSAVPAGGPGRSTRTTTAGTTTSTATATTPVTIPAAGGR